MTSDDPYAVLGIPPGATAEEVRRAFVDAARRHHPDRGGDPTAMQAVNSAWAVLGDPVRRAAWDRARHTAPPPPEVDVEIDVDVDADLFDDRPLFAPRRSIVDFAPMALFALSILVASVALVLDSPAMLGVAAFVFFLSCIAIAAVALLAMRRSVRAARR